MAKYYRYNKLWNTKMQEEKIFFYSTTNNKNIYFRTEQPLLLPSPPPKKTTKIDFRNLQTKLNKSCSIQKLKVPAPNQKKYRQD